LLSEGDEKGSARSQAANKMEKKALEKAENFCFDGFLYESVYLPLDWSPFSCLASCCTVCNAGVICFQQAM
jgi:hypothetical protein